MDPNIVVFAIDAGVRLGRKVNDVLVDATVERPMLLPVGDLFGDVTVADAGDFFRREENRALILEGGPYAGFGPDERVAAYRTLLALEERVGSPIGGPRDAVAVVQSLHAFEQYRKGFGANPPAQRILGTILEIGIDYFTLNPEALGVGSTGRKVLQAFIEALDETQFAEGTPHEIVGDLMVAAVRTLDRNVALVDDSARVQALVGGVTAALLRDAESLTSQAAKIKREQLVRRIGSSILRGGAEAFTEQIDLFVGHPAAKTLVESTLKQVLVGIDGKEDLFSNESFEVIFASALTAVGENPGLFSERVILQELIRSTVKAVTNAQGKKLFSEDTVAAIVQASLETARDNVETLFDPEDPQKQLLGTAIASVARSLASTLAGGGTVKDLLSKRQVVDLVEVVLDEVANNPERLLGAGPMDDRKTAVAQIIGSLARALGDDPSRFVNGDGLVELAEIVLSVSVRNADKLLDLDSSNTRTNALFKALEQLVQGIHEVGDPRGLVDRTTFLEMVHRVLPVVSANVEVFLEGTDPKVKGAVQAALGLATGALEGRINGANLPVLVEELLKEVLWDELHLDEVVAVARSAERILRAA